MPIEGRGITIMELKVYCDWMTRVQTARGNMAWDESKKVSRGHTEIYPEDNGRQLNGFIQGTELIRFIFLKQYWVEENRLWCNLRLSISLQSCKVLLFKVFRWNEPHQWHQVVWCSLPASISLLDYLPKEWNVGSTPQRWTPLSALSETLPFISLQE